jgi:RNA recognition motif-containing protein
MKIFVGNLSWDATEEGLRQLFEAHGEVISVRIVQDQYTGRSKGFGFVEMKDEAAGNAAIAALNDTPFEGRPLRISAARQEGSREGGNNRGPRGPRNFGDARPQRRSFRPRFDDNQ